MAEAEIRLVIDPVTGKRDVIIEYLSDEDALPMEHEEEHRRLVDRLIQGGAIAASELGKIVVRRAGEVEAGDESGVEESAATPQRRAIEQKG